MENTLPIVWFHPLKVSVNRTIYPVFHLVLHLQPMYVHGFASYLTCFPTFSSLNNSCFKILRVDSGERGNINLRPTPYRPQWKSLVICHPPWPRAMSRGPPHSLTLSLCLPQLPPLQGHLARPQPYCSNGANAIKEEDSCWCNLFWKSDECLWTDAMLQ